MVIAMLATDLDGTLLRQDGSVSPRTVAALAAARARGFPVLFASGRPPRWMGAVVAATGHGGVAICGNGALVVDLDSQRVLEARPLAADLLVELAATISDAVAGASLGVEYVPADGALDDDASFGHDSTYPCRHRSGGCRPAATAADLADGSPVVKLLVRGPSGWDPDDLLGAVADVIAGRAEATRSSQTDPLVEISAAGVSKGAALAAYAAGLGIAATAVAAVGDMPNDVSMLAWSGASYAVRDAHPAALAAARGRVPSAEQDGVAALLEALLTG